MDILGTVLSVAPPDHHPETPTSNVDDPEWIKGLVAKALLQAADEGTDSSAMPPTPLVPPVPAWPELATLDTSSYLQERSATQTPADMRHVEQAQRVTEAPLEHVAPPSRDVAPTTVPRPVIDSIVDLSKANDPTSSVPPQDQSLVPTALLEPQSDDHDIAVPRLSLDAPETAEDAVMVETTATTEGFRSSDIRTVLEWLLVIVSALVVALIIKAVVLQAFWIPSESMETTVNKGDRILVNKVSYRLHDVRRGDLVVFEKVEGTPGDTKDLIKRAIALPGETIEVRSDGRIWIWGPGETPDDAKLLEEPYLDPQNAILNAPSASDPLTADVWDDGCTNQPRTPGRCTLDDTSFFMMGDNRNRSSDSRFFGPVPEDNIVGRAFLRIWPLGDIGTL